MTIERLLILAATACGAATCICISAWAAEAKPKAGLLTRRGSELFMDGKPYRAVGVNKYDLGVQFIRGEAHREKAIQAIEDTAKHGFKVIRFNASGWYPSDLKLWPSDEYWQRMDELFAAARKAGVRLVPVLIGCSYQFTDLAGETMRDMLTDKDSKSRQYCDLYIHQFVSRYKGDSSLLFWELWSELNLGADLEFMRPYGFVELNVVAEGTAPARVRRDNYTTDEMIPFIRDLAQLVRSTDPDHLISSGHSIPRPAAQHLRLARGKGDWTMDSPKEAETYIRDTHPDPIDLISIHFYNFFEDNIRFGNKDRESAVALAELKRIADRIGKPILIGEAGGQAFDNPTGAVPPFSRSIIEEAVKADYPIIIWWMSSFEDQLRFELDKTPQLNKMLLEADRELNKRATAAGTKSESER